MMTDFQEGDRVIAVGGGCSNMGGSHEPPRCPDCTEGKILTITQTNVNNIGGYGKIIAAQWPISEGQNGRNRTHCTFRPEDLRLANQNDTKEIRKVKKKMEQPFYRQGQVLLKDQKPLNDEEFVVVCGPHLDRYGEMVITLAPYNNPFNFSDVVMRGDRIARFKPKQIKETFFKKGDKIILKQTSLDTSKSRKISIFLNRRIDLLQDVYRIVEKAVIAKGIAYYKLKGEPNLIAEANLFYRKKVPNDDITLKYMNNVILKDKKRDMNPTQVNTIKNHFQKNSLSKIKKYEEAQIKLVKGDQDKKRNALKKQMKQITEDLRKLNKLKEAINTTFDNEKNTINIFTPFMHSRLLRDKSYPIGHYRLELKFNPESKSNLSYKAFRLEGTSINDNAAHPCIGGGGHICFGSYSNQVHKCLREGKIFEVYIIFLTILKNYSGSPDFNQMNFWDGLSTSYKEKVKHLIKDIPREK